MGALFKTIQHHLLPEPKDIVCKPRAKFWVHNQNEAKACPEYFPDCKWVIFTPTARREAPPQLELCKQRKEEGREGEREEEKEEGISIKNQVETNVWIELPGKT